MTKKILLFAATLIISTLQSQIPTDGLQIYYPFDGNIIDYSGKGNHATTSNTSYQLVGPNATDSSLFTNNTQASTYYNYAGKDSLFNSQNFSCLVWAKVVLMSNTYGNILELGSGNTDVSVYFRVAKTAPNASTIWIQGGHYKASTVNGNHSQVNAPTGVWAMFGITSAYNAATSSRTINLYVDGVKVNTSIFTSNAYINYSSSYSRFNVGHRDGTNNHFFGGNLEDFTFYNKALTEAEVLDYYGACPFANVVNNNGTTLMASTIPGLSYQWKNCNSQTNIPGATSSVFTPTANGNYGVVLSYQYGSTTCGSTSECNYVSTNETGIYDVKQNAIIALYPNPATTCLNFELESASIICILNSLGDIVSKHNAIAGVNKIDLPKLAPGIYFLKTQNGHSSKFIVE